MFNRATAEFNLGHYKEAAAMYEDIYKITLEPVLLYNIGQAHRLAGNLDQAVFFYRGYLRAKPTAKNRAEVRNRIAELEEAIAVKKRTQERPPNAPGPTEPAPPPAQIETPSPPAEAAPAPTQPAPETAQPAPAEGKPLYKKWWFWTAIGGAVVVAAVVRLGRAVHADQLRPLPGAQLMRQSVRRGGQRDRLHRVQRYRGYLSERIVRVHAQLRRQELRPQRLRWKLRLVPVGLHVHHLRNLPAAGRHGSAAGYGAASRYGAQRYGRSGG